MNEPLQARARRIRERLLIRAWEYRQRNYSKGVWHRLRRVLVDAGEAWIIDDTEGDLLEAAGHVPHPVGRELSPEKRIFLISRRELETVRGRRQVPVRMSVELLQARNLALVPFGA
ncbi:MAG: hypothetical protein ACLQCB_02650 [Spirochaetia bacterium]